VIFIFMTLLYVRFIKLILRDIRLIVDTLPGAALKVSAQHHP
jgi:hypothetical protein